MDPMQEPNAKPYHQLGARLRKVRERAQESLAEVAGAVEIDARLLEQIEAGEQRPSEDILMLMIDHFGIDDHGAVKLWETAGYDRMPEAHPRSVADLANGNNVLMVAIQDNRVVYTDGVDIEANQSGLTLEFKQSSGNKHYAVAKVGMSHDQAKLLVEALQITLLKSSHAAAQRRLGPPQNS
jgi:transcriptional regulator with XRE-family HTH domain